VAIIWSNASRHDVSRIFDFNASYDVRRAVIIDERLVDGAERCARNPMAGRPIDGTAIRERSLADIQYVLRYRIEANGDITMLGIRHARENRDAS
jgi:plasmid stabilization system protein ParE